MEYGEFLYRISVSFILSLLVGLERQIRGRAIGLRTSVLVSVGTFMFVSFSVQLMTPDVSRIASQVVSGIGFLGAGVILKDGTNIKGLNTAATLWCSAAIGVLCAGGLIIEASIGTAFILFCNIVLRYITKKVHITKNKVTIYDDYVLKLTLESEKASKIKEMIMQTSEDESVSLTDMEINDVDLGRVKINAGFRVLTEKNSIMEKLMNSVSNEKGVLSSSIKKIDQEKVEILDDDVI